MLEAEFLNVNKSDTQDRQKERGTTVQMIKTSQGIYRRTAKMRKLFCEKMPSGNQRDERRVAQPTEKLMQPISF